ncbi:hypothetical protein KKI93_18235 [Xenorhabdus bovienii]|uniref:hypothetical protein n=1 Tax=Xenorhabdus bovienii TaxID=40576 RepID=UPI0023B28454|nr:hypothetical protein [Xenorhabdus bovienii]MDE9483647.1 hypothetical protein [Xenorhabdus bovienii]MDE9565942.1 hypothetical protein [Xenorhabdus bovienii]
MTDFTSLADGGELSRETWDDFVARLEYQHKGAGVDRHGTAHPSFTVRERVRVAGNEDDEVGICYDGEGYYCIDSLLKTLGEEKKREITEYAQDEYFSDWDDCSDTEKAESIKYILEDSYIFYWKYDYKTVNTHLTREAAERFIARKQHDHGELSVYVKSFYWCWEMRTLIDGILTGKIKYIGDDND